MPNHTVPRLEESEAFWQHHFRPALPRDRRQIRVLLRSYDNQAANLAHGWRLGHYLGLGLVLALILHRLIAVGGIQLLLYGTLGLGTVMLVGWLNSWLFADWQNYWVIEQNQQLIACARRTGYNSYAVLCDVVVAPEYRHHGVGTLLIAAMTRMETQPLYLACCPKLIPFYRRFQFVVINPRSLTAYLRRELGLEQNPALVVLCYSPSNVKDQPIGCHTPDNT
ncbi:MAG: GNAT family N-acetyltransferase [Leptolyngbya sp. IPPAS B-1204]|nr:GNAT family N-acetyltransferase [Elainella sp. C42_A2020_010]RNJ65578.1 MAG: N-acetyltransferase [Leptolyngbya sp. IPPAS B-1204]